MGLFPWALQAKYDQAIEEKCLFERMQEIERKINTWGAMRFIKTVYDVYVNMDDIYKVTHEESGNNGGMESYFYLRNDEKIEFYEFPDYFYDDVTPQKYKFDHECMACISGAVLWSALNSCHPVYDIVLHEEEIWGVFMKYFNENKEKFEHLKVDED
jgi:hypothetical protein